MKPVLALIRVLTLLASLLPFGAAQATHTNSASVECTPQDGTSKYAGMVSVGRDSEPGKLIGPWLTFPTTTWMCTRKASAYQSSYHHSPPSGYQGLISAEAGPGASVSQAATVTLWGKTYGYYKYSNAIRFIAEVHFQMEGEADPGFKPVIAQVGEVAGWGFGAGRSLQPGETFWMKATVRVRLIRTDSQAGQLPSSFDLSAIRVKLSTRESKHHATWKKTADHSYHLGVAINKLSVTCTTPSINVDLGKVYAQTLTSVGKAGPAHEFAMRFENCPPGMFSISYYFDPKPGQPPVNNSTLLLDPTLSSATGVGVQVMHPDDTLLVFGKDATKPLLEYDLYPRPLPSYTVPLKARIIRTSEAPPTPGTVHAQMNMTVIYK